MSPTFQRGYQDQSSGMVNAALAEADTPEGREYRAGQRQARRDAEDWEPLYTAPTNGTPIELRLDEKTIVTGKREDDQWYAAGRMKGATEKAIWHKILPPTGWRQLRFLPASETEQKGTSAAIPEQITPGINPGPHLGGAWSEPEPAARKPRKPKPADEGQASFL